MASDQEEWQRHLQVARVKKFTEPQSPIDIASRSVIDPTLAKLKHLINVPGLGFVKGYVKPYPDTATPTTGYHATVRTNVPGMETISLPPDHQ